MEDKKIIILNIIRNEIELMKKGDVGFNLYGYADKDMLSKVCDEIITAELKDDDIKFYFSNYRISVDNIEKGWYIPYGAGERFDMYAVKDIAQKVEFLEELSTDIAYYVSDDMKHVDSFIQKMQELGYTAVNNGYVTVKVTDSLGNSVEVNPYRSLEAGFKEDEDYFAGDLQLHKDIMEYWMNVDN